MLTVPMGPCAILIMVVMVVSVNLVQEYVPDSTPTSEPLNAKVFATVEASWLPL